MGPRIGLIAGSGNFPLRALEEIERRGLACVVAGIRGEASPELMSRTRDAALFGPAEIDGLAAFFAEKGVRQAVLVGKVEHRTVFGPVAAGGAARRFLDGLPDLAPSTLLRALIAALEARGLEVLSPSFLLAPLVCAEGALGPAGLSETARADADFGWPLVQALADLDIGQTLVVKDRAVVAVEGMEGTDETIKRGARLAGKGTVVLKAARHRQDMRVDMPAVGAETVRALIGAGAAALIIEAGAVPFFDRDEALAMAGPAGLAVVARAREKEVPWTK